MLQAGVIVSDYATLMVEILKDNARPEAALVYDAMDMPWAKLVGQIAQACGSKLPESRRNARPIRIIWPSGLAAQADIDWGAVRCRIDDQTAWNRASGHSSCPDRCPARSCLVQMISTRPPGPG